MSSIRKEKDAGIELELVCQLAERGIENEIELTHRRASLRPTALTLISLEQLVLMDAEVVHHVVDVGSRRDDCFLSRPRSQSKMNERETMNIPLCSSRSYS